MKPISLGKRRKHVIQLALLGLITLALVNMDIIALETVDANGTTLVSKFENSRLRNITELVKLIPEEKDYGNVTVEYLPLDNGCQTPQLFTNRENLCWNADKCTGYDCKVEVACAPKILLLGVMRAGSGDLSTW